MGIFTRHSPEDDYTVPLPQPYSAYRALTAAAIKVNLADKSQVDQITKRRSASIWQDDAWEYFDIIGEIKYAFRIFSSTVAKIKIHAAWLEDEDELPVALKDSPIPLEIRTTVNQAMRRAFSVAWQAEMLRKLTLNLLVAGECYLVQLPPVFGKRATEEWRILSISELVTKGGKTYYREEKHQKQNEWEQIPLTSFVGRIWQQHGRYYMEPDSSMHAVIDTCDELMLYTRASRSSARSRLNAGAFFVPDSLSVSTAQPSDDPNDMLGAVSGAPIAVDPEDDLFEQELMDAMTTPISDESSAASVVPLIIRGPAEAGNQLKYIKFDRPFDPQLAQRADKALGRIMQGLDIPTDLMSSFSGMKYSNVVQMRESLYTDHVEPLILLICDALRLVYLVPALQAAGLDDDTIRSIVIWYDPSGVMAAPDKSNAANVGFDKFALSWSAWRRANGFNESDAPDGDELAQRIAVTRGQLNDQLTEQIFRTIMPGVINAARQQAIENSPTGPMSQEVQNVLNGGEASPAAPPDVLPTDGSAPSQGGSAAPAPPGVPPIVQ